MNNYCIVKSCTNPVENRDLGLCASHNKKARDNEDVQLYYDVKKYFLEMCVRNEMKCPVTNMPITMQSDVHHMKGRLGYANEEKKKAGIKLLYDPDFFLAVSRAGHNLITDDRDGIAIKNGWSYSRADVIF